MLLIILLIFLLLLILQNIHYVLFFIIFFIWNNRDFSIRKKDPNSRSILLHLTYHSRINMVELRVNNQVKRLTIPSSFNETFTSG